MKRKFKQSERSFLINDDEFEERLNQAVKEYKKKVKEAINKYLIETTCEICKDNALNLKKELGLDR